MAEKIFCCNIKNIPKNDLGFEVDLIVSGSSPIIIGVDPETIIIDDCTTILFRNFACTTVVTSQNLQAQG